MELDAGIIFAYASDFLKEDLGRGDVTTQAVVRGGSRARGQFLAKQDLVLCGLEFAEAVFGVLDNAIALESHAYDGQFIGEGIRFARIDGPAAVLLAGERTALNLLQHMSGIATLTRAFVDKIRGTSARIVDTRKTTPGLRLIEKYAVSVGGGGNHRFGLDDGVLIKDNHIALAGGIKRAVELARNAASHLLKVEVEVSSLAQAREALEARTDVIMLDNMSATEIAAAAQLIREHAPDTIIEASGNITLDTVREVAESGVDLISVGAITHSARAVDISMKISAA
ncbi:MAG TPA: carboxylating nicotinate-nucleotide diphosphorylase [Blastocatellia bacterium]|nr:carboxylating nicotinate-nucleotide diphosphorylase [Blastocatellia bacterium]